MLTSSPSASIVADKEKISRVVLMPGDPLRAKYVADTYLKNPVCFNSVRNMLGFTGEYKGKQISVMGHGMGIPSIGIYTYELYKFFDVDAIIRIGSAGGLQDDVKLRSIVIAMSASTNSNYGNQYGFPGIIAPTADYGMLTNAVAAAKDLKADYKVGNVFSSDQFYNANSQINQMARDFQMLCVEMETAGLYWNATYLHKKALGILSISDHLFTGEALTAIERQESFGTMMEVALETAWKEL